MNNNKIVVICHHCGWHNVAVLEQKNLNCAKCKQPLVKVEVRTRRGGLFYEE